MYLQSIGQKCVLIVGEVGGGDNVSQICCMLLNCIHLLLKKLRRHTKPCDKGGK